jgi:hypothetical protein
MKQIKMPNMKIKVPEGKAFAVESPENMPRGHFLLACVGKRGSGKMVSTINFIEKFKAIDRLFYVSPSANSNSGALNTLSGILDPDDMYSDVNDITLLADIVKKIEAERDEYEEYHEKMKIWKQTQKEVKHKPIFSINEQHLITWNEGKPTHKWNGKIPVLCIFFDDIIGSQLLLGKGQREIARLCLYHRHLAGFTNPKHGGAVGCSMLFNVQSWKTSAGGLPKALRNNLTIMILFKTSSQKELEDISESVEGEIPKEKFYAVCDEAWKEPHDFLLIDLHPKSNHPSMFRRNLDTFLIP